jgi:hypothetical protein
MVQSRCTRSNRGSRTARERLRFGEKRCRKPNIQVNKVEDEDGKGNTGMGDVEGEPDLGVLGECDLGFEVVVATTTMRWVGELVMGMGFRTVEPGGIFLA